jgi:hypothetical protein
MENQELDWSVQELADWAQLGVPSIRLLSDGESRNSLKFK